MYKYKISKIITIIIHVISVLILFLPFAEIYDVPTEEGGEWVNSYGFESFELIILLSIFYFLWIPFQFIKNRKAKIFLGILCLILSFFCSFYAIMACIMPIQDFIPSVGVFLLFSIFPFLLLLFIVKGIEYKIQEKKANSKTNSNLLMNKD